MHDLFDEFVKPILNKEKPRKILEIGVARGRMTIEILRWASLQGATVHSVDPVAWEGDLPQEIKKPCGDFIFKRGIENQETPCLENNCLDQIYKEGLDKIWSCSKQLSLNFLKNLPNEQNFDCVLIDGDHNYYTVFNELKLLADHTPIAGIWFIHDVVKHRKTDMYYDSETIPKEFYKGKKQGIKTAINDFLKLHTSRIGLFKKCAKFQY